MWIIYWFWLFFFWLTDFLDLEYTKNELIWALPQLTTLFCYLSSLFRFTQSIESLESLKNKNYLLRYDRYDCGDQSIEIASAGHGITQHSLLYGWKIIKEARDVSF